MTPQSVFREHILMALDRLGGSAKRRAVLDELLTHMDALLDNEDWDAPTSRPFEPRWRNAASWERADMVRDGLLRDDSKSGVWELSAAGRRAAKSMTVAPTGVTPSPGAPTSGAGHSSSSEERHAIEWHAMRLAQDELETEGWVVERVHLKGLGFDLLATRGRSELHVEVKGTTTPGADVEVTIGEVRHARALGSHPNQVPVLIVVSDIMLESTSPPSTSGGVLTRVEPWDPSDDSLSPTRFRYRVS